MESTTRISVIIITRNEEKNLPRILASLTWCQEIIVVDSGSSDRTTEIAQQMGAKVFHREFNGYGEQKQFAVAQTSCDWILSLDADEFPTADLVDEIQLTLRTKGEFYKGYYLPISLVFQGHLMQFAKQRRRPHLRLFNKRFGNFNSNSVHEGVVVNGPLGSIRGKGEILHYSYENLEDYFNKFNRYTSMAAEKLSSEGKTTSPASVIFRFFFTFFKIYIFHGALFDGYYGFLWALNSSCYNSIKYAKLIEIKEKQVN